MTLPVPIPPMRTYYYLVSPLIPRLVYRYFITYSISLTDIPIDRRKEFVNNPRFFISRLSLKFRFLPLEVYIDPTLESLTLVVLPIPTLKPVDRSRDRVEEELKKMIATQTI